MMIDGILTRFRSTGNLGRYKGRAWKMVRHLVPSGKRFFFEGEPDIPGQLWYQERIQLYRVILEHKPQTCFEIGTWKGGGSTFFIAHALERNGSGKLHTIEMDEGIYSEAKENYDVRLNRYSPFVELHRGDYREVYPSILKSAGRVDFLILDGPEDALETLSQYNFFQPYFRRGTVLMVHDWFTEKSRLVRPLFENATIWEIEKLLKPPVSLGLLTAIMK